MVYLWQIPFKMKVLNSLILLISILFTISCSKDDSNSSSSPQGPKPTVTLNGEAKDTLSLNQQYVELGATAIDANGTDISSSINISGAVDYNKTGLYVLKYTATDSKNVTSDPVNREILVKNDAEYLVGVYTATHKCSSSSVNTDDFQTTISVSTETNNKIFFSKLNPVSGQIEANVSGIGVNIPQAFDQNNNQYSGNGTISNNDIKVTFNTDVTGYSNCTITLPR